jgi:hypothetical protein
MTGGAHNKTALEATGVRLAEMLRRALADRMALRLDGLSMGAAERADADRQSNAPTPPREQGVLR